MRTMECYLYYSRNDIEMGRTCSRYGWQGTVPLSLCVIKPPRHKYVWGSRGKAPLRWTSRYTCSVLSPYLSDPRGKRMKINARECAFPQGLHTHARTHARTHAGRNVTRCHWKCIKPPQPVNADFLTALYCVSCWCVCVCVCVRVSGWRLDVNE